MSRHPGITGGHPGLGAKLIDEAPEALPPVASKHLLAAWEIASDAACEAGCSPMRMFAFRPVNGRAADVLVADRDAACWVGAIERAMDIDTRYGLSVCLRLLALVHLLGRKEWASRLALFHERGIRLDPALLRAAAEVALTADAQLDEQDLLTRLPTRATMGAQPGA